MYNVIIRLAWWSLLFNSVRIIGRVPLEVYIPSHLFRLTSGRQGTRADCLLLLDTGSTHYMVQHFGALCGPNDPMDSSRMQT